MNRQLIEKLISQKEVGNGFKPFPTRLIAFLILDSVFKKKAKSDEAINFYFERYDIDLRDKNFILELVKGTIKKKLFLDFIIKKFARERFKRTPSEIIFILRMGLYQILFMTSVPEYAAVNESVNLCELINKKMKRFTNAVLRNIIREKDKIELPTNNPILHLSIKHSFPEWMIKRWITEYGIKNCELMCDFFNESFEICLRTNRLKTTRDNLLKLLKERGINCRKGDYSENAIYCSNIQNINKLDLFQKGFFFIQGEASMLISEILNPEKGSRILDMCSAPGGKATHLAELIQNNGEIIAADIKTEKLNMIEENAKRLGISCIKTHLWHNTELVGNSHDCSLQKLGVFDYVLIDAPCSGLGILRKLPDLRWNKKPEDIKSLKKIQSELLEKGLKFLKRSGILLYSVCTLTKEENEEVIMEFLNNHPELQIINLKDDVVGNGRDRSLPSNSACPFYLKSITFKSFITREGFLKILPFKHKIEGFFAAKIQFK